MFGALGKFFHQIVIQISTQFSSVGIKSALAGLERLRYAAISITDASRRLLFMGVALSAALIFPVKSAVDFNWAMTDIQKTTRLSIEDIQSGVFGLVKKGIPETIEGFLKIAKIVGQAGVEGKDAIFGMTQMLAKLDIVSDVTAEKAGESIIKMARLFKVPFEDSEKLGSTLVHLANITTTTEMQIISAVSKAGKAFDVLTFDKVAGLAAGLMDLAVLPNVAGTGLRNIFLRAQTNADKAAKAFGVTKAAWMGMLTKDPIETIFAFAQKMKGAKLEDQARTLKNLFGAREYLIMSKFMNNADRLRQVLAQGSKAYLENTTLSEMMAIKMMSPMAKLIVFWNHLKMLFITTGQAMLPMLDSIVVNLTKAVKAMVEFVEQHPRLAKIGGLFLMISAASALLSGGILRVVSTALSLTVGFGMLKILSPGVITSFKGIGLAVRGMLGPIGWILLALGALIFIFRDLYKHNEDFRRSMDMLKFSLGESLKPAALTLAYTAGVIVGIFRRIGDEFGKLSTVFSTETSSISQSAIGFGAIVDTWLAPALGLVLQLLIGVWQALLGVAFAWKVAMIAFSNMDWSEQTKRWGIALEQFKTGWAASDVAANSVFDRMIKPTFTGKSTLGTSMYDPNYHHNKLLGSYGPYAGQFGLPATPNFMPSANVPTFAPSGEWLGADTNVMNIPAPWSVRPTEKPQAGMQKEFKVVFESGAIQIVASDMDDAEETMKDRLARIFKDITVTAYK